MADTKEAEAAPAPRRSSRTRRAVTHFEPKIETPKKRKRATPAKKDEDKAATKPPVKKKARKAPAKQTKKATAKTKKPAKKKATRKATKATSPAPAPAPAPASAPAPAAGRGRGRGGGGGGGGNRLFGPAFVRDKITCRPADLKVGDWFSEVVYLKKTGDNPNWDASGGTVARPFGIDMGVWTTSNSIMERATWNCRKDLVQRTVKLTRAEMISLFQTTIVNGNVFRVTFRCKPKPDVIATKVHDMLHGGHAAAAAMTKKELAKALKPVVEGRQTTLTGFMKRMLPNGRVQVVDLNKNGIREVDTRTVSEVVFQGVLYQYKY